MYTKDLYDKKREEKYYISKMKSDKNFKNKKSPGITLWDKDPPLSSFSVDCLLLSISVPWRIVCFSNEMPLEETKFSFSRGYQLDIASRLEMRAPASVSQMLRLWARHISWPRWWFRMMMRLENARSGKRQWGQWAARLPYLSGACGLSSQWWAPEAVNHGPWSTLGICSGMGGTGQFSLAHENGPGLMPPWELLLALHDVPARLSILSSYKDNCKWEVI